MFSIFSSLSLMPRIETDRLVLREMKMRDAASLFSYCSDPAVSRYVLWDTYKYPSQARDYIRSVRRQYRQGFPGTFAIELKETGRLIGTVGFMWINPEHRSCEVGYSLSRREWNKGYATEALKALNRYAFNDLHLNRVEAQYDVMNPASGRVMEKAGMHYEGTLRQRLNNKGRFVDVNIYAILQKDFQHLKEDNTHAAL
ncbi:MAG: GNAT family N-acetyltransferase [Clostridia bacterium]|nr:GNAT family N-acetyltransferase [Clostridia bacterium]